MKFVDFKNNLKNDFLKVFPNSTIKVVAHNNLYKSIYIDLYFANKTEELSNGYLANDMFKIGFRKKKKMENLKILLMMILFFLIIWFWKI